MTQISEPQRYPGITRLRFYRILAKVSEMLGGVTLPQTDAGMTPEHDGVMIGWEFRELEPALYLTFSRSWYDPSLVTIEADVQNFINSIQ